MEIQQTLEESAINIEPILGFSVEQNLRENFYIRRKIPDALRFLEEISQNFYWSWAEHGAEIFRELEPSLWQKTEQNPRELLKQISELRLWQKSTDSGYVKRLKQFFDKQKAYLSEPKKSCYGITEENPVAYFCAEYGVHTSLPIYSGGLGILAGDHLKSASDLNMPLIAVGLFYRYGYFRQRIAHDGWQEESYQDLFRSELALKPVVDENNENILISVRIRQREVFARAWLAEIGRIKLYLLDTNIALNDEIDRYIAGHLYGGDTETRVVQEKVLGIGGVRLLRKLGISPSVYHLNEGHSAFLTLELAREFLSENPEASFYDAVADVREKCVFTTHTPVAAGNDLFSPAVIGDCFDAGFIDALKISNEEFFALGRAVQSDSDEWFGMTPLALRMTGRANGVSRKHGEVSRELWHKMYSEIEDVANVPITHITNGVHAPTWVAPILKNLYVANIGENWDTVTHDEKKWRKAVSKISDREIWETHQTLKNLLISFIRQRTKKHNIGFHDTINERENTDNLFDPDILTIGFARRVATYKRWDLLMTDLDRLLKLVDDPERPVQFVFAGKAHPQDRGGKQVLQHLMSINHESNWQKRAVFIEDYDQEVARYLVQGVDVWMNLPRRPLEASGTSGQKAGMNGALNFSILDGWWIEGDNGKNGYSVGLLNDADEADENDQMLKDLLDAQDAESLYQVLENEIIPTFYSKNSEGLPADWIAKMRESIITITSQFSSDRMVKDYFEKIYRRR